MAGVFLFRKLASNEAIAQSADFVFVQVSGGVAELLRRSIRSRHEAVSGQRLQDVLMVSIHVPTLLLSLRNRSLAPLASDRVYETAPTFTAAIARASANMRWHRDTCRPSIHHYDKETLWLMICTWTRATAC